jgi:hypothetical protein
MTPIVLAAATNVNICIGDKFVRLVSDYINIALGFAIILAIILLVIGGYQLVISTGNAALVQKGKKRIFDALIGLVIIILSATILNFLNPQILTPTAQCTTTPTSLEVSHEA